VSAALEQSELLASLEDYTGYRADFDKSRQLRHLVRTYGLRPETTLFVGDSLRDVSFARRARTQFRGLTRIFNETEFRRLGADSVQDLRVLASQWDGAMRSVASLGTASTPTEERDALPELGVTPLITPLPQLGDGLLGALPLGTEEAG
jgi:hypothetical protein